MGMCCKSKQTATDKPILPPPLIWCETPQQLKVHQNTITLCLFQTRLLSLLCPCSNPFVNMWSLNGVKGQGKEGSEVMTLSCRRSQGLLKKPNKKKMGEWKSKNLFSNLINLKIERNCSCCLGFFFLQTNTFQNYHWRDNSFSCGCVKMRFYLYVATFPSTQTCNTNKGKGRISAWWLCKLPNVLKLPGVSVSVDFRSQ